MKHIVFSPHSLQQLLLRGATEDEVRAAIYQGERQQANRGRSAFRKNFPFHSIWKSKFYEIKQVMPIIVEEEERLIVVTVFVFYFGGNG